MTRSRRLTALVSGALLLQLVLSGNSRGCVTPAVGATPASVAGDSSMPGMDMGPANHAGNPVRAPASGQPRCPLPSAPAGCQPMALCATLAVASATLLLSVPNAASTKAAALVVIAPTSRSTAPDPPPPRA